jgi:hypothetical protein
MRQNELPTGVLADFLVREGVFELYFRSRSEELMQGETRERWVELCEQAAVEQDHDRLLELIREISALLDEKEVRLQAASAKPIETKKLNLKADGSIDKLH